MYKRTFLGKFNSPVSTSKKETEILHASSLQRRGLNCSVKASLTNLHEPNVESCKDFNGLQHFLSLK